MSRTLAIIKPDAYQKGIHEFILEKINEAGFKIVQEVETVLTKQTASGFYREHQGKAFYDNLIDFMTNKKLRILILEKANAVELWRDLVYELRSNYTGPEKHETVVHGSDSDMAARRECDYFFGSGAYLL